MTVNGNLESAIGTVIYDKLKVPGWGNKGGEKPQPSYPLEELLTRTWESDAHTTLYHVPGEPGCPRVNKHNLEEFEEGYDVDLMVGMIFIDMDTPNHVLLEEAPEDWADQVERAMSRIPELNYAGVYTTDHGLRFVWPLDTPVRAGEEAEKLIQSFSAYLYDEGLPLDLNCWTWNHIFRLPHVLRHYEEIGDNGEVIDEWHEYTESEVDIENMDTLEWSADPHYLKRWEQIKGVETVDGKDVDLVDYKSPRPNLSGEAHRVRAYLSQLSADISYDAGWNDICMALHHWTYVEGNPEGLWLAHWWSERGDGSKRYSEASLNKKWRVYENKRDSKVTMGTVKYKSRLAMKERGFEQPTPSEDKPDNESASHEVRNFTTEFTEPDDKGKVKAYKAHVSLAEVLEQIEGSADGWPKVMADAVFVPGHTYGELGSYPFIKLDNATALMSWLKRETRVKWTRSEVQCEGEKISPVSSGELFSAVEQESERYAGYENMPHYPPIPELFYHVEVADGDGETLEEFVDMFNPMTELDRLLIKALIVTPYWGAGSLGKRPAFVLSTDFGIGAGKSATMEAIAMVYGGAIEVGADQAQDNWDKVLGRILTPSAVHKRLITMDNIKEKLDIARLESLVTSAEISGHQYYRGEASIPNKYTIMISDNLPQMSTDLAGRSIIIKLGKSHEQIEEMKQQDFKGNVAAFLSDKRYELLGDIQAWLKKEAVVDLTGYATRFQAWERKILGPMPKARSLIQLIKQRQGEADEEADEAETVMEGITQLLVDNGYDPINCWVHIPTKELTGPLGKFWADYGKLTPHKMWKELKPLLNQPLFQGVAWKEQDRSTLLQGLVWKGEHTELEDFETWNPKEAKAKSSGKVSSIFAQRKKDD